MIPYRGNRYLSWPEVVALCESLVASAPEWVELGEIGRSREGRPILVVAVGAPGRDARPAVWIDGGTHAAEFTGVMAAVYTLSDWVSALVANDAATVRRFSSATAYVVPCMSPDGYVHMHDGGPFIRSSLRPPRDGDPRSGFEPGDIDGDGAVRWMRWRHPGGAFVQDEQVRSLMRPRTLDDDPADAFFFVQEGRFLDWDGFRWTAAPRRHGLDLNRNFPAAWRPFAMFGMDGGAFALSEPESRAVVDAVLARRNVCAALSGHTYTGCILTQPYRADSPLTQATLALLHDLASDLVAGTSYRVFRVHPEFVYDPRQDVVGVWADTLCTVLGIPGYTVEYWDPFGFAGEANDKPAEFFRNPNVDAVRRVFAAFEERFPELFSPWTRFDHPQLGAVEIGGIDYMRTIRNPPESLLETELRVGLGAANRLMRALPDIDISCQVRWHAPELAHLRVTLENRGYLSTAGLEPSVECPGVSVRVESGAGVAVIDGPATVALEHLEGWGALRAGAGRHPVYPELPERGHRALASWWLRGSGSVRICWTAGRAGSGEFELEV